jgi:hypothetical protein
VWLFDFKTGKGVYGETALQLAAYARADVYVDDEGNEQDMPTVDGIAAVHVRADGYAVYGFYPPIDDLHRTFTYLAAVHRSTADMREWVTEALDAPQGVAS